MKVLPDRKFGEGSSYSDLSFVYRWKSTVVRKKLELVRRDYAKLSRRRPAVCGTRLRIPSGSSLVLVLVFLAPNTPISPPAHHFVLRTLSSALCLRAPADRPRPRSVSRAAELRAEMILPSHDSTFPPRLRLFYTPIFPHRLPPAVWHSEFF